MTAPEGLLALDVHALQVPGWADRGVGRYVANYSAALAQRGALRAALLAPELPPAAGLPNELVAAGLVHWDSAATCRELLASGPRLAYHLTAPFLHTEPGEPPALGVVEHWAAAGVPRVVLLHDLIPLRAPRHYLHAPGHEPRYRTRAEWVSAADLVVTNSDHTREEAVHLLGCDPERVVTVGVGVSPFFSPPDGTDQELFRYHFPDLEGRPFVITVGGSDVRKGTDRAIAAFGLLAARGFDVSLLVVGHLTAEWLVSLRETAAACGVAGRVVFGGAVDDELLRACYRRAVVSLMPSLAEGAGLPVLESAACGTPALASATSALGETAVVAQACFDPTDADSIAEALAAALDSADRRAGILTAQQSVAEASTWDAVAGRAVAAFERLIGGLDGGAEGMGGGIGGADGGTSGGTHWAASRLGSSWPARMALVGWPGSEDRLLRAIAADWAGVVDVVPSEGTAGEPATWLEPAPGGRLVSSAAFGVDVRPASYDQVVYVLSGGPADRWVCSQAGRYAGWLWLWRGGREAVAGGRLRLEPLVRRSRGLLVGSADDLDVLRLALRPMAAVPPIGVVGEDGSGLVAALRGMSA